MTGPAMKREPTMIAIVPTPEWREALLGDGAPASGVGPNDSPYQAWDDGDKRTFVECPSGSPCSDFSGRERERCMDLGFCRGLEPTRTVYTASTAPTLRLPDGGLALPLLWNDQPVPDGIARAVRALADGDPDQWGDWKDAIVGLDLARNTYILDELLRLGIAAEVVTLPEVYDD